MNKVKYTWLGWNDRRLRLTTNTISLPNPNNLIRVRIYPNPKCVFENIAKETK